MTHIKRFGTWESPITSSMLTESAITLGDIVVDEETLYWNESRPLEKGRSVIVRWDQKSLTDLTPPPYHVRTRVHEYGGGSFTAHKSSLYFSNFKNQHFYSLAPDGTIKELTTADHKRYANPVFNPKDEVIYAIEETHLGKSNVINTLVAIDVNGKNQVTTLQSGADFYSSIALHPQHTHLAFLRWNHPLMPWDGTELLVGELLPNRSLTNVKKIAGSHSESIFQPRFAPDGTLFFISDRTGFWNLYQMGSNEISPCYPLEAEFGVPQWLFGMSRYDFILTNHGYQIGCIYTVKGVDYLAILDLNQEELIDLSLPYTHYADIHISKSTLYFSASSPTQTLSLLAYDLASQSLKTIRKSKKINLDSAYLSKPQTLEFPTENGVTAFGFYYPPQNRDFIGPAGKKPPLIVKSHGGPSSHATPTLSLQTQFWTSRGFAFLDVNYGGSTGYGREFRERLKENWGIVDVNDCINGALYLVKKGAVDPNCLIIKGGSAGGYTTLSALVFTDVFKAGTSYYGVSDLEAMIEETHKFESHYLDHLIGPYKEKKNRYIELSPIHQADKLSAPMIFLQGGEDKVVPPSQSQKMYQILKQRGIPVAYLLFEGEGHGFRNPKNIKKALDAELYFYSQIFHFTPNDALEAIPIENLENGA